MRRLNFFKRKVQTSSVVVSINPYNNNTTDHIYNQLFCDNPELCRHDIKKPYPYLFNILHSKECTLAQMRQIINDTNPDPQVKISAGRKYYANGYPPKEKELFAVIIEVGQNDGLKVLALFYDGTAICINPEGRFSSWLTTDDVKAREITKHFFDCSLSIVKRIESSSKPRRPNPQKGDLKITFIASDGLYFGEGPIGVLYNESMAGPALRTAFELEKYLCEKSQGQVQMS